MPKKSDNRTLTSEGGILELLSALFSGFLHPVIVKDERSRFVHVNPPACALLGYSAQEIVGRTDHDFLPSKEADAIVAMDREILTGGKERIFEEVITPSTGESRTLVTHKHSFDAGLGQQLLIAVITDVTELRQAERALRDREEHYRSLIELHPQVPWVANADGEVTEVGPTWSQLSGRPPEAAYGMGWASAIHPGDLQTVQQRWAAALVSGNNLDVECRIRAAGNDFHWVRNRAAPRRDENGRILRWYGLLEDIHERKSAEEALRESEARFRLIADSVPVMIWLTDENGFTTYLNRNWLETTGQTELDALGHGWLDAVHPDDRETVLSNFERASRDRTTVKTEYRLRRSDGEWAWVIDIGEPRLAPDGSLLGFAGSVLDLSERRTWERALEQNEAFVRSIFDSTPDCVRLLDLDGEPLLMNRAGRELFGLAADEELNGHRWDNLMATRDSGKVEAALAQVRSGRTSRFESEIRDHNGKNIFVDVIAAPIFNKEAKPARILTIWRDVTDAKAAQAAAEEARIAAEVAADKLASVLESTLDCVVVVDHDWRLTYINSNAKELLNLDDDAVGQGLWTLYPEERDGVFAMYYKRALTTRTAITFEDYLPSLGLWLEVHAAPTDEGLSIFFRNTSDRRRAEQERFQAQAQIFHMSRHDALTNLPNRIHLHDRLARSLAELRLGAQLAVLILDLDGFKSVNDTYGHPVGDVLLCDVASRLHTCLSEHDVLARTGGDEFVVIRPDFHAAEEIDLLAGLIVQSLQRPFDLGELSVSIGTNVGIAFAPDAGNTVHELLRASDVALHRARADGRGRYRRYAASMDTDVQARQELTSALGGAVNRGELLLYFQPLVNLRSRKVSSCEALVRWRHPVMGMVPPADFIPIAEESGLIGSIGDWVLQTACNEASCWEQGVAVAVNLSPLQFADDKLVQTVADALATSRLLPSRLQLEITESVMLDENERNLRTLQELRLLGVKIAMDDFGTGYSSLGYLRRFPFDKIKVDRGFISDLPGGRESLAIVRAVAGIGRSLGITTTVEGVETQEQLEAVKAEGFDEAQGYLFSPPVPKVDIQDIFRKLEEIDGSGRS